MKIQIKNRYDDSVIFEGEFESLLLAVEEAVRNGADLNGANLDGANLYGADLYRANLDRANLYRADLNGANLNGANLYGADLNGANHYGADLDGANLDGANLYGADLNGANLYGADLDGANLDGANLYGADLYGADLGDPGSITIGWSSHALLSEILWRAAGDNESRQMLASYVGRKTCWCWGQWRKWEHPEKEWALVELSKWVMDGDGAPEIVRELAAKGCLS